MNLDRLDSDGRLLNKLQQSKIYNKPLPVPHKQHPTLKLSREVLNSPLYDLEVQSSLAKLRMNKLCWKQAYAAVDGKITLSKPPQFDLVEEGRKFMSSEQIEDLSAEIEKTKHYCEILATHESNFDLHHAMITGKIGNLN